MKDQKPMESTAGRAGARPAPVSAEQLLLSVEGLLLVDGADLISAEPGPDVQRLLDRTAQEADGVRAALNAGIARLGKIVESGNAECANGLQLLTTALLERCAAADANTARLLDENRRLQAQINDLRSDLHHREVMAPLVHSLVAAVRETERRAVRAETVSRDALNEKLRDAMHIVIRSLESIVARLEGGLSQYGVTRFSATRGDKFTPGKHAMEGKGHPTISHRPGTVRRCLSDGWVDERTGWVYQPALVEVYVNGSN